MLDKEIFMAIMIPSIPNDYTPESREGELFMSLQKLSDDYYVFHSFRIINLANNDWKENEIDFVIFNRQKGIICLEAKAGHVQCIDGKWYYASGREMRDPFEQANSNKWKLKNEIYSFYGNNDILRHCKMLCGVWFPALNSHKLSKITLPQNAPKEIILTADDLDDPTKAIERIFNIKTSIKEYGNMLQVDGNLAKNEANSLLANILCPSFNILPSKTLELDYKKERLNALIKEQCNLLNYLKEQRSAVINGAAGTGKTMIAIEKARRHSANGESVLFLCFNSKLKDFLEVNYRYPNVEYYTIDGFACKLCNAQTADFEKLELQIIELVDKDQFPYTHIIIDEGQDLGQERIQSTKILGLLESIVLSKPTGTFYVFYDKLQLVQSYQLPKFIQEADCKLTLYKNCRNTKKIAETSFKPLKAIPKLFEAAINGNLPDISFVDERNKLRALDAAIKKGISNGITDIQIISCAPTDRSIYQTNLLSSGNYLYNGKEIKFTTCRKFKGLEADMVILVDVNFSVLHDNNKLFYVGSSRARLELCILCNLNDEECTKIISDWGGFVKKNNPKHTLSKMLGCKLE